MEKKSKNLKNETITINNIKSVNLIDLIIFSFPVGQMHAEYNTGEMFIVS